jgi:serine protease Do
MRKKWQVGTKPRAIFAGILAVGLAAFFGGAITLGADLPSAASVSIGADSLPHALRPIMEGSAALGLNELRAMQGHVTTLADALKKCTVGVQVGNAWGSGVIISKDGYVLSAAHVAGQPNQNCSIKLSDGRDVTGKTLGMFRTVDAGLMKITQDGEYPFAELGDSAKVKFGNWCIALGHPGGFQEDRGLVLRLGRVLAEPGDHTDHAITTDCTLVGGDSGGPLFDLHGRVIGINSRIGENNSTNMHVPVNTYHDRDIWNRMVRGDAWGRLPGQEAGWLGVRGDSEAKEAKILSVLPGSPAENGGMKAGDVVLALDERPIADFPALTKAIDDCRRNESVKLKLRRSDQTIEEIHVRLGKRPS